MLIKYCIITSQYTEKPPTIINILIYNTLQRITLHTVFHYNFQVRIN